MNGKVRPSVSNRNQYYIDKHRYYELKHFCLQYPVWRKLRNAISGVSDPSDTYISKTNGVDDPTARAAMLRAYYSERIELIERAANETDAVIGGYLLKGVTEGLSYDQMAARYSVPCCREVYYRLYRRFFWLLDQIRR